MAEKGKFRVFDKSNIYIRKYCERVLIGHISIREGAKLANVNLESFRRFVNEEKAKAQQEAGGDDVE